MYDLRGSGNPAFPEAADWQGRGNANIALRGKGFWIHMISMLREKRRIGFFGGTFDPFHRGHLAMAKAAAEALHLHHVSFVPTSQNPLKGNAPCATDRQRVEMIQLGIASNPLFGLWDGELERDGPSYTIDTVEQKMTQ